MRLFKIWIHARLVRILFTVLVEQVNAMLLKNMRIATHSDVLNEKTKPWFCYLWKQKRIAVS